LSALCLAINAIRAAKVERLHERARVQVLKRAEVSEKAARTMQQARIAKTTTPFFTPPIAASPSIKHK
jgi:hypothetical protein